MTNIKNATVTAQAVGSAYDTQPGWLRYKGTILIILTGLVSTLSQLAAMPEWDGTTLGVGFTIAATVIGAAINRGTKDGITPSMVSRIARFAPEDTTPDCEPEQAHPLEFPVVDPDLDYDEYITNMATPETGRHRAGEV